MKKRNIAIDYRTLILSTVKERYFSFTLGVVVVLLIASIGFSVTFPRIKLQFSKTSSKEKGQIKGKEISKKKEVQTYVVKEGDDLSKIALNAYGDIYAWEKIADANNISNPDILQVGKILIIPRD